MAGRRALGERTLYEYGLLRAQFVRFWQSDPERPFAEMAQAWLQKLSPSRQRVARAALRHHYGEAACDWRELEVVRYQRNEGRLFRSVLTEPARERLELVLKDDRERAMLACLYTLRRASVAALRWGDVDLGPGVALVRRGKGGKSYWTVLTPSAQTALAAWYDVQGRPADDAPVFPTQRGGHYSPATLGDVVRGILQRAGLWKPGIGLCHRFRRSFATEYLRQNAGDLNGLRIILGHEDISTTVGYCHISPAELAPRVARVNL